jgi:hypothetical protein
MLELWDGTRKSDKLLVILSQIYIQPTTSWLIHILESLGARTSHGDPGPTGLTTAWTRGKPPPSPI